MSSSKNNKDLQLTGKGLAHKDRGLIEARASGKTYGDHVISGPTINKNKNMKELIEEIEKSLADAKVNLEKFEKGNGAAGRRLRADAQAIRICCLQIRDTVSRVKNARKAK